MLPRLVHILAMHGAYIVGSQARKLAGEEIDTINSDWDLIVPFDKWHIVASLIPNTSTPNSFGGWRFKSNGCDIDVWPDDVVRFLVNCKTEPKQSVIAFDFINSRVISSQQV